MNIGFFNSTCELKERIRAKVKLAFEIVENEVIRRILLQRQETSSYIKGTTSYLIHRGLGGTFSEEDLLNLASSIEIHSTSMVLMDNMVDKHSTRDGQTTYLNEYGPEMTALASIYATSVGLIRLAPYLNQFFRLTEVDSSSAVGKAITGAVSMDVEHPKNSSKILENIVRVNGLTLGFPLGLVASTATQDKRKIFDMMKYGSDTGTAFGLYEEIRDFVGEHGRGRASEMKDGRIPYFLADLAAREKEFDLSRYIGKELSDEEYNRLSEVLRGKRALQRTKRVITNHLNYGREAIERNLAQKEFNILDLLRQTVEDSLERMV